MKPLRKLFLEHVGQTSDAPLMIEVDRAEGVFLYGPDGKRYFDLVSGVSVSNVGHSNPQVVEAVCRQARDYMHLMVYGEMVERPQVEYAARLASQLPASLQSVYFVNSGSEAIEGALKLAKRYTGRTNIVAFRNAYHGSTHGSLSVMGGEEFRQAFRPLLPGVRHIGFNETSELDAIDCTTACVLVEPVQGEGGIRTPRPGFLEALRARCDEVGALLIFDEIQTGMGRTGRLFAFQKYGVVPDILCLAKAFGGGMPLGGFIASAEIMGSFKTNPVLGHITTFGGHPVCCAAGLASLDYLLEHRVIDGVEAKAAIYRELVGAHPLVRGIRGSGLILAVELGDPELVQRVMAALPEAGVVSDFFLFCDTAFRIAPPLVITEDEVRESARIVLGVLDRMM